jgi:hypothetical protein
MLNGLFLVIRAAVGGIARQTTLRGAFFFARGEEMAEEAAGDEEDDASGST